MLFGKMNIRIFLKDILNKTRNFLLTEKFREFLVFLFFVVVSSGFWVLQTLDGKFETEFSIPLKL